MKLPLVHIVIVNWNGLSDTLECLASLAGLTYSSVRVVVVDNGSKGDQAGIIEEGFPGAVVLRQSENLGFCGACNIGIRYAMDAGADFVLLLNNDALATPDLIEKLLDGYQTTENAGAISPVVSEYPEVEKISYLRPRWVAGTACFILKEDDDSYDKIPEQKPFAVDFAIGCCMLVPVDVYRQAGLLDERYFAFYDEIEWCYRIRRLGYESYVVPGARVFHKVSQSTPVPVHTYLMTRNRLLWMKENLPVRKRLRPFKYLFKEYIWHVLNSRGLTEPRVSRTHSRAFLRGCRDYFRGRFYKWDEETEKEIFGM